MLVENFQSSFVSMDPKAAKEFFERYCNSWQFILLLTELLVRRSMTQVTLTLTCNESNYHIYYHSFFWFIWVLLNCSIVESPNYFLTGYVTFILRLNPEDLFSASRELAKSNAFSSKPTSDPFYSDYNQQAAESIKNQIGVRWY